MRHYHELVPLHSRIFSPINKFYTALIFIYYFLISTGVSYIFFTTKSVTMTGHFFVLLPDLKWNQPASVFRLEHSSHPYLVSMDTILLMLIGSIPKNSELCISLLHK